ncbi:ABC transporter transmembrane region [Purpureocillium lavendulum]|uniref:ABC transporter transmembrane region n=1 Tax=Purpureocillium lavendulum TaxID=1247861 RepID=A0AB34FDJ1_9HYPO|nr:ABC transporter transmembrane region [Purpureocillium lavendulum]
MSKNAEMTLRITENLEHKNLLARIQEFGGGEFIAWEFMPMSLLHLARSRFLNELGIASILGQALHDKRLEHCGLSCSTVLISSNGVVKIGGLEHCKEISGDAHRAGIDGEGLKRLTLELVDGHYIESLNGKGRFQITNVNLDNLQNIVDFIDKLNGRVKISTLQQQKLFRLKGRPEVLKGMIAYAQYFALFFKEYPSQVVQE